MEAFSFYREKFRLINLFFKRTDCQVVVESLIFINYQLDSGRVLSIGGIYCEKKPINSIVQE